MAALSGHVLQANSPNKNNGNVTLERYTGANNQHWKILKNGTQVAEPCTHKNISNKNENSSTEQKNDDVHTMIKTYDKVCIDCGKTVESNVKETKTEKHTLVKNKCKNCGYEVLVIEEKPVESTPIEDPPVCKHEKTYTVENSVTYGSTDKDINTKYIFRTLTPVDFSSDNKKLVVKEKIGYRHDGIWKTDLWVYNFETEEAIKRNTGALKLTALRAQTIRLRLKRF